MTTRNDDDGDDSKMYGSLTRDQKKEADAKLLARLKGMGFIGKKPAAPVTRSDHSWLKKDDTATTTSSFTTTTNNTIPTSSSSSSISQGRRNTVMGTSSSNSSSQFMKPSNTTTTLTTTTTTTGSNRNSTPYSSTITGAGVVNKERSASVRLSSTSVASFNNTVNQAKPTTSTLGNSSSLTKTIEPSTSPVSSNRHSVGSTYKTMGSTTTTTPASYVRNSTTTSQSSVTPSSISSTSSSPYSSTKFGAKQSSVETAPKPQLTATDNTTSVKINTYTTPSDTNSTSNVIVLNTAPPSDNPNSKYTAEIVAKVYLGNVSVANDVQLLKGMSISDVIVLGKIPSLVQHAGLNYTRFEEAEDSTDFELFDLFDDIADAIRAVTKKRRSRVIVVDSSGISMSPAALMAYLMREHEQTLKQATATVQSKLNFAQPNSSFLEQLLDYDLELQDERNGK